MDNGRQTPKGSALRCGERSQERTFRHTACNEGGARGREQPLHELTQRSLVRRFENEMKVIRHQAETKHLHPMTFLTFSLEMSKGSVRIPETWKLPRFLKSVKRLERSEAVEPLERLERASVFVSD